MATVQEPALDEIQWSAPDWVGHFGGIHENTVLFYFARSPFFDPTSNNAAIETQATYNPDMMQFLETRDRFEAHLRTMQGLEYLVHLSPKDFGPEATIGQGVWVIRKQNRRKRAGYADEITILGTYFVIGDHIYMAPSVANVLQARILSTTLALNKSLTTASSLPYYTPSLGHRYFQPISKARESPSVPQTAQASRDTTPMPESSAAAPIDTTTKAPSTTATATSSLMNVAGTDALYESFRLFSKYEREYMNENPLIGEPGSFVFTSSKQHLQTQQDQAAKKAAQLAVPKPTLALKTAPTPEPNLPPSPIVKTETLGGKKSKGGDRAGQPKAKRRKSKATQKKSAQTIDPTQKRSTTRPKTNDDNNAYLSVPPAIPMSQDDSPPAQPVPRIPFLNDQPRVWFLTSGNSPIGASVARNLLEHGDSVVAGVLPAEYNTSESHKEDFEELLKEMSSNQEYKSRFKVVSFDIRSVADCQSASAEAVRAFGRVDVVLLNNSEALLGTLEELAQTPRTQSLVTEQFQTNFFGPVNIIKALLPTLREQKNGHILLHTGITAHIGTPGLGIHCASQWAIEGYCDSIAYEIAPFNIKLSIIQSNIEIAVLTHKLVVAPAMEAYTPAGDNNAPIARRMFKGLLEKLDSAKTEEGSIPQNGKVAQRLDTAGQIEAIWPPLPKEFRKSLIEETVYAVLAIGGHENPPARHIVGLEGTASVKEKLRTVSEELEDFVDVSCAVDL